MDRIGGMKSEVDPTDAERPGYQPGGQAKGVQHLALTGPSIKAAAARIAPTFSVMRQKSPIAPGTTELFAIPVLGGVVEQRRIPTSILELLGTTERPTPTWEYLRQVAHTSNAAIVKPGEEKPVTEPQIEKVRGELHVVAHVTPAIDKYLLLDYDQLASFIGGQLLYGLGRKVEGYVIGGTEADGIVGLLNTSGIQSQAFAVDAVTTLRQALTMLEVLGHEPGAFILNPLDWAAIETARATSGSFDLGGPVDRAARKLWGVQVVPSTGVPQGTGLALDLSAATVDKDTQGATVEWSEGRHFTTNGIVARVEGRFGLSVTRPDGIIKVDLTEGV